ncbi:MAG: DUF2281 domain-containing protein [Syntrophaceae bacterium]|nr:DUF2281 domain-containing protein [Syntrophaceae bacterium]
MKKEILLQEIENIPEDIIKETVDFLRFLKQQRKAESMEITLASESSLKKDWLKPEEDEAWQNL